MKTLFIALLSILFVFDGPPKLVNKDLAEGIQAGLPKDFYPMTDDDIAKKYPSTKKPIAMYTNIDRIADFGVNVTKSRIPGDDLKVLKSFYKASINESYERVNFSKDTIERINGKNYITFEFTSLADKTSSYSYVQYVVVNGFVYIFNFTAPDKEKQKWQPVADAIMHSVKIDARKLCESAPANPKEPELRGKNSQELLKEQNQRKNKKTK